MTILPAENVDLISPFPPHELHRLEGWGHCYTSAITPFAITEWDTSWGVIDRENTLGMRHEVPLVGVVVVRADGEVIVSSTRKAFKAGMVAEALKTALPNSAASFVTLNRANTPMIHLFRALGFIRTSKTNNSVVVLKKKGQ